MRGFAFYETAQRYNCIHLMVFNEPAGPKGEFETTGHIHFDDLIAFETMLQPHALCTSCQFISDLTVPLRLYQAEFERSALLGTKINRSPALGTRDS